MKDPRVQVPSLRYPSMTSLRRSLVHTAMATLLHVASVNDSLLEEVFEMLPWHTRERLAFVVSADVQNNVSIETAAEPPEVASEGDNDEQTLSSTRADVVAGGSASSHEVPTQAGTDDGVAEAPRVITSAAPPSGVLRLRDSMGLPLRVAIHSWTDELKLAYRSLSRSFVLADPPTTPTPADLCYRDGGTFLWNATRQCPASAAVRASGAGPVVLLKGSDMASLEQWQRHGNAIGLSMPQQAARAASDAFHHFCRARPHLSARIPAWTSELPPFADGSCGSWLRGRMTSLPGSRENRNDRIGWHGTALHYLERVAARGLEDGWSGITVKGHCKLGVYFHIQERARLCFNYILYSALEQDSGFVFAPFVELRAPSEDPHNRTQHLRRPGGRHQELTYEDVAVATDVWIHVRHVSEFLDAGADDSIHAEGHFEQALEADALLPRQTLIARAKAVADAS